ncbi:MAG: septum formation initiator family protein [bacterium]
MKRTLWTIFGLVVLSVLTYYVMTHPNLDRVDHLRGELDKLQAQNNDLAAQNKHLEDTVRALRDDPRLAERRARAAGLARPGEVIYQFEEPDRPVAVQVTLNVKQDAFELAGKTVALKVLDAALAELKTQLPGATLQIEYNDDVDAILKQQVLDAIEASPFGSEKPSEESPK